MITKAQWSFRKAESTSVIPLRPQQGLGPLTHNQMSSPPHPSNLKLRNERKQLGKGSKTNLTSWWKVQSLFYQLPLTIRSLSWSIKWHLMLPITITTNLQLFPPELNPSGATELNLDHSYVKYHVSGTLGKGCKDQISSHYSSAQVLRTIYSIYQRVWTTFISYILF